MAYLTDWGGITDHPEPLKIGEKMSNFDRNRVVINYYKASSALMEIGTTENIPSELLELSLNTSRDLIKIIDYINSHKSEEPDNNVEDYNFKRCME